MALTPDAFAWVADLVRKRSAIQLPVGKEYLVESRLLSLAKEHQLAEVQDFIAKARAGSDERLLRAIVEALTTNETSWFRDNIPFASLRQKIVPDLLAARSRPVHLRFWSAACSTGQEPYSLAMALTEALPPQVTFEILATDLSQQVLDRAASGRYSQLEVNRGLPAPLMVRYFTRSGAEWEINQTLRSRVTFRQHNLMDPPPVVGRMDVILLRNVLIYFDLPTKQAILRRMAGVLADDGTLLLGAAETTIGLDTSWERVQIGSGSGYRKKLATPAKALSTPTTSTAGRVPTQPGRLKLSPAPPRGGS
ncbi:MAG: protein-glutamate O-methyltransferase CheR [Micrococcales bacterium]|nr:protein-glutamate O-methyltransferase CheR [Micrococcales bacterium]MCL2668438.1 protein-glutamate O-methyltransferase CheR [Micrococcales bacterium]